MNLLLTEELITNTKNQIWESRPGRRSSQIKQKYYGQFDEDVYWDVKTGIWWNGTQDLKTTWVPTMDEINENSRSS